MSEGYLIIDHRCSPGIPEAIARGMGLPPAGVREGAVFEAATKRCRHCGGVVVLNPERKRLRASCAKCAGEFICDACATAAAQPGYTHRSFDQIADLVRSGRFTIGGDLSAPILIPVQQP